MKTKLILLCTLFLLLNYGLAICQKKGKGVSEVSKVNPKFSYSPEQREQVASSGLTIALLTPSFSVKEMNEAGIPWSDFLNSMINDIEELLTSKGFKVRGPVKSVDELVYSDKSNSDLILQITIDLNVKNDRNFKTGVNFGFGMGNTYFYKVEKGNVSMSCDVILTAYSCFTYQKLWKKNIDITNKDFSYVGSVKWDGEPSTIVEFKQDANLWNPICNNMEIFYKDIFSILYKQFDREEVASIAKESRIADKDKRN
jgi:hypothetical protein